MASKIKTAQRKKLAAKGQALKPDASGRVSDPIPDVSHLKAAIRSVGRLDPSKRPAAAKLIRKRGRELGATHIVKGSWADNSSVKSMSNAALHEITLAGGAAPAATTTPTGNGMSGVALSVYKKLKAKGLSDKAARAMATRASALHARKTGASNPKA